MYQINIARTVREKVGKKKFRKMSKWWIPIVEKIIHQKELNEFLATDGKDKVGTEFAAAALDKFLNIEIEVIGAENIPENGKLCFVSNHPLGGIDGLTLLRIIGERYDDHVKVILNSFLAELPGLAPFSVPVEVGGSSGRNIVDVVNEIFESDDQIIMFPAQKCSRKNNGIVEDLPWKKGFIQKSAEFNRDIIPIYFHGFNSNSFYRFANFTERLSKKLKKPVLAKLPMIFLPHEMLKNRGQKFTVIFGKPISAELTQWRHDENKMSYQDLAQDVRAQVYMMRDNL